MLSSQFPFLAFSLLIFKKVRKKKKKKTLRKKKMKGSITLSFLIIFIFHFLDVFAAPSRHLCNPDQRDAILEFKNEFETLEASCFDSIPPKTESWTNNSDCCYWDGIKCDAKFGDVVELDLSFSCLSGQLNSNSSLFSLPQLRSLTTLDLSNNDFIGKIPSSLETLSNLTTLDISRNHFNGRVPSSVGNLSHLTFLDFSHNNFSGQIPSSLGHLSLLKSFNLSFNNFSGRIPSSIGNLSSLTNLCLTRNSFDAWWTPIFTLKSFASHLSYPRS